MSEHRRVYDWIPNETATEHLVQAAKHAALHPKGRTCFRRDIRADGIGGTTVEVCDEAGEVVYTFDDTFQCPPRCGGE